VKINIGLLLLFNASGALGLREDELNWSEINVWITLLIVAAGLALLYIEAVLPLRYQQWLAYAAFLGIPWLFFYGLRGVMEETIIASSLSYAIATIVEVVLKRKTKNLADS